MQCGNTTVEVPGNPNSIESADAVQNAHNIQIPPAMPGQILPIVPSESLNASCFQSDDNPNSPFSPRGLGPFPTVSSTSQGECLEDAPAQFCSRGLVPKPSRVHATLARIACNQIAPCDDKPTCVESSAEHSACKVPEVPRSPARTPCPKPAEVVPNPSVGLGPDKTPSRCFEGVPLHQLLFVEICAGSARLSKAAKKQGFSVLPVDNSNSRASGIHICLFDLTDPHQFQCLMDALRAHKNRIILIFVAPPCGTASRAREKPIKGIADPPKQLRSDRFPNGLPTLQRADKIKTEVANLVYEAVAQIVIWSDREGIPIVIENPLRSYLWQTTAFQEVDKLLPSHTVFQNCMHGSTRDKWTMLRGSTSLMEPLALLCDKKHRHGSWRPRAESGKIIFPTHSEAAYPELFCQRVSGLLMRDAVAKGALLFTNLQQQALGDEAAVSRLVLSALPRSAKIKPIVSDFGRFFALHNFTHADLAKMFSFFPKGTKILSRHMTGGADPGDCLGDLEHTYKAITLVKPGQIEILAKQYVWCKGENAAHLPKIGNQQLDVGWLSLQVDASMLEAASKNGNPAERLSEKMLRKRNALSHEMAELADLLPSGTADHDDRSRVWCSGTSVTGTGLVVCVNTRMFRNSTILCAAIIRAFFPGRVFSSVKLAWGAFADSPAASDGSVSFGSLCMCVADNPCKVSLTASCMAGVEHLSAEERLLLVELGFYLAPN